MNRTLYLICKQYVSCCDTIETLIALKGLPDAEKIELFRLTLNRASELEKEMQNQFDWGLPNDRKTTK